MAASARIALIVLALGACAPQRSVPPAAPRVPPPAVAPTPPPPPPPEPAPEERTDLTEKSDAPKFVVHIADVGTGLAVFVEGEDFALVYDAGSNDDKAKGPDNRFVRYLHTVSPDLRKIDHVVLSHPHTDHVELLPDVISSYDVSDVWDSGAVNPVCGYRRFLAAVAASPTATYHSGAKAEGNRRIDFGKSVCKLSPSQTLTHGPRIREGAPIRIGKRATMTFLHVDGEAHGTAFNENSLVAVLDLDGTRVLLMGDAEAGGRKDPSTPPSPKSVEGYLLEYYRQEIDADIFVAGHHGSMSSSRSAFVDAVSPKLSIISSGPMRYGSVTLPDPEVVTVLEAASKVLRTDVDDAACATNKTKIGQDDDGKPGGCDNIQIQIRGGRHQARYAQLSD